MQGGRRNSCSERAERLPRPAGDQLPMQHLPAREDTHRVKVAVDLAGAETCRA